MPSITYETLRQLLAPWGPLRPQPATDWRGEFPLPQSVAQFYEKVGPWGELEHAHHGPTGLLLDARLQVTIPPLCRLWEFQAGFRWNGNTLARLNGWKDEWLLVAHADADPFILDMPSGQVFFAHHGAGAWHPLPFAPDLATAIGALATIANAKAELDGLDAFLDDETFDVLPAATKRVRDDLAAFLGSNERAQDMLVVMEWG